MTRKKTPTGGSDGYAPGHFTSLIHKHNWPPMWQPSQTPEQRAVDAEKAARVARWRAAAAGKGWAQGTLPMPNTPKNALPAWQVRMPQ